MTRSIDNDGGLMAISDTKRLRTIYGPDGEAPMVVKGLSDHG